MAKPFLLVQLRYFAVVARFREPARGGVRAQRHPVDPVRGHSAVGARGHLDLFKRLELRPRVRHLVSGYETVRPYVSMGHGYSLLNWRLARDVTYAGGRVVPLELADDLPPIEVVLVRLRDGRPTRKSSAFEEMCIELHGGGDAGTSC